MAALAAERKNPLNQAQLRAHPDFEQEAKQTDKEKAGDYLGWGKMWKDLARETECNGGRHSTSTIAA